MLQHVVSGLATGSIYALLALAVALIYLTTRQINLAQGEMAMFATFVAWQLMSWGVPYWPAFVLTVVVALIVGAGLRRVLIAPLSSSHVQYQLGAMAGLLLIFNSAAGFLWGQNVKAFPSPFGTEPVFGSTLLGGHRVGMIVVTLVLVLSFQLFLTRTRAGLRLRAAAENPASARLSGINVERIQVIGWGVAAAVGAIAGMLIAPVVVLDPQMMFVVFPYAVAAAVLGGLASPIGAVVAGYALGVVEALSTAYLPLVGRELKLSVALAVIFGVLVLRPQGLFGARPPERV